MYALVEFFGGPAWTAAVALGAVIVYLAAIDNPSRRPNAWVLYLAVYFLVVLAIRGILISLP